MKVFVFDLLAYGEQLDHLKVDNELPYPLPSRNSSSPKSPRAPMPSISTPGRRLDRLGYDGVGLQRAPFLALWADEFAEPPGGGRGAAHQEPQAPDLRQPAAAARAAAARRGTGDARLPVERPADLRLRARHSARIPGAQRAAGAIARPLRGGLRDHHPRLDRGDVLLQGRLLVLQATWRSGRARCSSRTRRSGCRSSAARNRSSSPARHDIPITPGLGRSRGLRDDIIRYYAQCLGRGRPPITPDHLSLGINAYVADTQGAGGAARWAPTTSISTAPCSATATSPRRAAAPDRLCDANPRPTTCGPENQRAAAIRARGFPQH